MHPVALITGASRGIGRGIALALAPLGYDLVLNFVRNREAAEQTAALCRAAVRSEPIRAWVRAADIGQAQDRRELIDFVRAQCGRLDLLVNNAGVAPAQRVDLLDATEESFDRLIAVNLKGPYFLTQLAAQWMIAQQAAGAPPPASPAPRPKIVMISSISAYAASTQRGDYCVAKAGLAMATALYAARLAEHGILVYEIRPGIIATDMTEPVAAKYDALIAEGLTPIRRWGTPEDVGKAVAALAQEMLPYSTGEVINVDGGFHLRRL